MKVCVIGLGYIGLPTAAMFASAGHEVLGVDKKPQVVDALNRGKVTISEPGLADFVGEAVRSGRLRASTEPELSDAFIITVPTPITEDKRADLSFVESAARSIVPVLKEGDLVVLESTSPVGTVDSVVLPILEESGLKAGRDFGLGYSPERVIPGKILSELTNNSRIAGGVDAKSAARIAELYKSFVKGEIYETDDRTAEMCKLSENTFRDVNIAFANELAKICEKQGIDVWKMIELCNKHPRVNIHNPGPGVGGHCIPVDPWFIVEKEPEISRIIRTAREMNDSMPLYVADKIDSIIAAGGSKAGARDAKICVLGVTYKPNADDIRESPVLELIAMLNERGYNVVYQDPFACEREDLDALGDVSQAAEGAELIVLGVDHDAYRDLNLKELADISSGRKLLDTRNFFKRKDAEAAGFEFFLLGEDR